MKEDVWIPTTCSLCYSMCAIRVHRVNGVVRKIEGNPDCPTVAGRICPRGLAGIMLLYDPNRVNVPLKRTNPDKGIGVDPKWEPISWKEALEIIAEKLSKLRAEDPRQLLVTTSVAAYDISRMSMAFAGAFGTPNFWFSGAGTHCGNGEHLMGGLLHAAWARQPDTDYMNYFLNFGCPTGFGSYYSVNAMSQRMSDARVRGMRHVVIDPWLGPAAEKADEWIPIRPGTDACLALCLVNILVNELSLWDAKSIKRHTNGPYLIGPDGLYIRDGTTGKPLVWDIAESKAKSYDDPTIKDFALEGHYFINGLSCQPAFQLIMEQVNKYTPEMAAKITTIPAPIIRRIAKEFGEAARIGSTTVIEGKELPYRPVGVGYFKGAQGHRHSALTCMALELLTEIIGCSGVPGGMLGMNARSLGSPFTGNPSYCPYPGPDGLLVTGAWAQPIKPYPMGEPRKPESVRLQELVPTACVTSPLIPLAMLEPERFGLPYKIGFHLHAGSNYLMTLGDPNLVARAFKDVFTVSISLYLDESVEMADIVLPDACFLERLDIWPDLMYTHPASGEWSYHVRQPVVSPLYERRPGQQVLLEMAEAAGFLKDMYTVMNAVFDIRDPFRLNSNEAYSWEEIVDRRYRSFFGPQHGLDWFKENGVLHWPKKIEEVYWKNFVAVRVPIYFESFLRVGQQIEAVKKKHGLEDFDTSDFQALPEWKPCPSYDAPREGFDLFATYYRVPIHTFSSTYNIPWLDEAGTIDPYAYQIIMNAETAKSKGIRDGDWIELESAQTANKVKGRVRLSQGIHPEVITMANCGGHWARGLPIASQPGKGACFEWLMALDFDYLDTVALVQDLCIRVRVKKLEEKEAIRQGHGA